ncbi:hypothetical protein [Herminiimonas aquatilis]|uniref:Uncharacterized protein n=1 Tax=Herminiimonas aquatilis TaxID=345342 RepID=A0ABW2J7C3_9BURK
MHRREIEVVEAGIGISFQDASASLKGHGEPLFKIGYLIGKAGSRIKLGDSLMLRKAIHLYISLANEVPCSHFNWNDEINCGEFSGLGKRLVACIDLYQKQILGLGDDTGIELSWNSDIYAESANVRIFRKVLVRAADEIRKKHRIEYLSNIKLGFDETEALQRSMRGVLALMNRPWARSRNKRLYDEMFKTKHSLQECLQKIKNTCPRFGVLPLILSFSSEERSRLLSMLPSINILRTRAFPANYLNHFEHASVFASSVKKQLNREVVGHLIKLTGANSSDPQCILLLFFTPEACSNIKLLKLHLNLIWADHVFGVTDINLRSVPFAPGIKINTMIETSKNSEAVSNLVESVFIRDLKYQRLRLPARRRSWSKSNFD